MSGALRACRMLFFFCPEVRPASIFIHLSSVSDCLPSCLSALLSPLHSCFSVSKALVVNMKQVDSEEMKVGRDRTEAGSEITLESA